MAREYKNYLDLHNHVTGDTRRLEMLSDIMKPGAFLPNTVVYEDIDKDFTRWAEEELVITSDDGKEFPTIVLYSNQRFSEYSQTWDHIDNNNNLLLNFKAVARENNPQYGSIQNRYWNIPGNDRFYLMKREIALDDNGSESILDLKVRQPVAVDLNYKLTIFTTQYHSINDFNILINRLFSARQCYLQPNGHFMPMTLESISDESSYNIDDRQFYGQTYNIKVMAYVFTEDDFRVEERPLKLGTAIPMMNKSDRKAEVDIEECENSDDVTLTIYYPPKGTHLVAEFTMDTDVTFNKIEVENLYNNYEILVNGEKRDKSGNIRIVDGDKVKIRSTKQLKTNEARMIMYGKK